MVYFPLSSCLHVTAQPIRGFRPQHLLFPRGTGALRVADGADQLHADFTKPAQVRWVAVGHNVLDAVAMPARKRIDLGLGMAYAVLDDRGRFGVEVTDDGC